MPNIRTAERKLWIAAELSFEEDKNTVYLEQKNDIFQEDKKEKALADIDDFHFSGTWNAALFRLGGT